MKHRFLIAAVTLLGTGYAVTSGSCRSDAGEPRGVRRSAGPTNFQEAKKHLRKMYPPGTRSLYADCAITGRQIEWDSCCLPREGRRRHVEWEHVVPASWFGRDLKAWKDGDPACTDRRGKRYRGRRCAALVSEEFRRMEGDMHNLFPTIGALNEARSNFGMGMVPDEPRRFGTCDFEILDRTVEPRPGARGEIARAYLYMEATYPGHAIVTARTRPMFDRWNRQDPPDAWEQRRNVLISKIQGKHNRFIR